MNFSGSLQENSLSAVHDSNIKLNSSIAASPVWNAGLPGATSWDCCV